MGQARRNQGATPSARGRLRLLVGLGAALLFWLEPMVGRLLLPGAGGAFHVWATCLLVFQATLVLAYLYCHLLAPRLGRGHLVVASLSLLFLPLAVTGASPGPPGPLALGGFPGLDPASPVGSIVRALAVGVGLPFALLGTTSVLAQAWLAREEGQPDPYALYAASNLGSLVALLAYPLAIERLLGQEAQRLAWSALFLVYLGLLARSALAARAREAPATPTAAPAEPALGVVDVARWLLLSAAPSALLVAVTNVIAADVGSLPLVWVLPLALYLLSFVLAFAARPRLGLLAGLWPEALALGLLVQWAGTTLSIKGALAHLLVLLVVCLAAQTELHRTRPAPARLTAYYLALSVGGLAGCALVTLVAPRVFTSLAEYPLALLALGATLAAGRAHELPPLLRTWREVGRRALVRAGVGAAALAAVAVAAAFVEPGPAPVHVERDAYGIYRVFERPLDAHEAAALHLPPDPGLVLRFLYHGTTAHGAQVLRTSSAPGRPRRPELLPLAYYHPRSPLGDVMLHAVRRPRRGAVIGLGTGATAAYFTAGDALTFFELDPAVEALARRSFTYLADCGAQPRVEVGDGRLLLERAAGTYDVIVVDAFSSDSVPAHLLTTEALALYLRHLADDGLIVLHVSSRYYELRPVVAATGAALGLACAWKARDVGDRLDPLETASIYAVLARTPERLATLTAGHGWTALRAARFTPWTDDHADVIGAMKWWEE